MIIVLDQELSTARKTRNSPDKLATELSGILNWAIVGYRRLTKRGYFVQPESAREVVEDIETLGSPIKAFVRDLCEVGPGLSVAIDSLYRCYKHVWCEAEGRKDPGTKEWFGRNLHSAVPGLKTTRPQANTGKPRSRIYKGIRLRPGVWNTSAGKPKNPTRATTSKCKKNKRKRH